MACKVGSRKNFKLNFVVALLCLTHAVFCETEEQQPEEGVANEESSESAVLVLTSKNFDDVISANPNVLVEFYAPWCGHCKQLEPEYEKAAAELKDYEPKVVVAKVDATEWKDLAERFEVQGYPTIKFFKNGEQSAYDGARTASGIVEFLKERSDPDWKPPPSVVKVLTTENFTEFTNNNDLSLVEFYAPWCGHCKQLAPVYEAAAVELSKAEKPIPLAKVDATTENQLATSYNVTGYPTLVMFRKGRQFEYKGDRTEAGIIGYMRREQSDASRLVGSLQELRKALSNTDTTMVGFFQDEEADLYQTYIDMSNDNRNDFTFVHTMDEASRKAYDVAPNTVLAIGSERFNTKYEPKQRVYKGGNERTELYDFVVDSSIPLVGEYTEGNKQKRYGSKRPLLVATYMVDWSHNYRKSTQMWRLKIADIANKHRDLTFAVANEEQQEELLKSCGLDTSGEDMNVCILGEDGLHYPMLPAMEEYDSEEIEEFIVKFKKGNAKRHLKSQPAPKGKSGPVQVVVGTTFEQIVLDEKKDVLIEFYAPWCGHCKKLEPVYKKFAKKIRKNEKNLVIAKIDATANDYPKTFEVKGYPTLYMVPAGKSAIPVQHEGANDPDALTEFVKKHATASFQKDEL